MIKYRSLCLLLLMIMPGIVTIIEANAQTDGTASPEIEIAARQKINSSASALIKDGKFTEAYTLLATYQSDYAGDPEFDYLLGIAALDSGKATEAIFALERVLAVNPAHLQARAEIARAYMATGETAAAKQEFETVQQQNPPKEVSATIQKYLDIIETARTDRTTSVQGYIEARYGNDSNVNSATANSQIAIPAFGGLPWTVGVANSDHFSSVATGVNMRHAVSAAWAVIGGANFSQRMNANQDIFDTGNLDGSLGASLTKGDNNYSAILQLQRSTVDNTSYRDAKGMTAQWQSNLSNSSQASSYLQYSSLTYPSQSTRDADRYVVGAAYARSLVGNYAPVVYLSGYGGSEKERQDNKPYLGHNLYGLRIGGEIKFSKQTTLLASASAENRKYGGQDPYFLVIREDKQADLGLGLSYTLGKRWTISSNLNYTRNDSNVVINDYARTVFSAGVRRNFN